MADLLSGLEGTGMKLVVRKTFWQIDGGDAGPGGLRRSRSLCDMAGASDRAEKLCPFGAGCATPPTSASASSGSAGASDVSRGELETDGELDVEQEEGLGLTTDAPSMATAAHWAPTGDFLQDSAWMSMQYCCWVQAEYWDPSMAQSSTSLEGGWEDGGLDAWPAVPLAEAGPEVFEQRPEPPSRFGRRSRRVLKRERVVTTLILKNLPTKCSRSVLMYVLDMEGFAGEYDFIYVPTNLRRAECCGYAFVNATSREVGERLLEKMQGFDRWDAFGVAGRPLEACWSESMQGLEAHVERYRNSPVMRPEVPDECKPLLLVGGLAVRFPAPTKRLKALRLRRGASDDGPRALPELDAGAADASAREGW